MTGAWAPTRYDMTREVRLEDPAHVGAIPGADHPVQPFGIVTNLNQDLTVLCPEPIAPREQEFHGRDTIAARSDYRLN